MRAQSPGVGVANVIDPALHRSVEFGKGDVSGAVFRPPRFQLAREFDDVARLDAAMCGIDNKAQPRNAVFARNNLRLRFVDGQTPAAQKFDDGVFPFVKLAFAVTEQGEVVNVTQICRASQVARDKPVQSCGGSLTE